MGGPSGGSTGGGGGGVGPAGKKKDGTYGTKKDAKKTSNRNEFSSAAKKVGNFIGTGGITGAIVRGITQGSASKNKTSKSGDVYGGSAYGYNEAAEKIDYNRTSTLSNRGGGNTNSSGGPNIKSIEQPKVASQMDNSEVKSDLIMADKTAPTDVEMTDDELLLKRKRGRKTKTVLTSVTGDTSKATLSKKALLG